MEPRYLGTPLEPLPDDPAATLQVRIATAFVAVGMSVGVPMAELVAVSGVSPEQFGDPDGTISIDGATAMLRRLEQALPHEVIALKLMAVMPASAWGLIDLASQGASTVGEAVDIYLRYGRLTSSHVQNWLERSEALVVYRCRHLASVEALRHPIEVAVAHAHRVLRQSGAMPEDIIEAHFPHGPTGPTEDYEAYLGCPVHFESFGAALVVRKETLDRPARHPDPVLSRSLQARLEADLSTGDDALSQLRREVAAHARPAGYAAATIAQRMGRSLRSLQRDASAAGTTLRQIIDDMRMARARELLLDNSLSVDEVGFLVDYSERAAFSRAFKRATGETPVAFRRRGGN